MSTKLELIRKIETAFQDVALGNGIGLHQAQGIDDYQTTEVCNKLRAKDEKTNWKLIKADDLNNCNSSLSFFDPEGMRFHLPAFIIADLKGELKTDIIFHLAYLNDHSKGQHTLLNPAQKSVIREYLELLLDDPDYSFDQPHIERALKEYW